MIQILIISDATFRLMKLGKLHFDFILLLSFPGFQAASLRTCSRKSDLCLWTSGWQNRDSLQTQPLWTFKESEASHLQLHLDSVDGQDFILERKNIKISTELLLSPCCPASLRSRSFSLYLCSPGGQSSHWNYSSFSSSRRSTFSTRTQTVPFYCHHLID